MSVGKRGSCRVLRRPGDLPRLLYRLQHRTRRPANLEAEQRRVEDRHVLFQEKDKYTYAKATLERILGPR